MAKKDFNGFSANSRNPIAKYNYHYFRYLCPTDYGIKKGDNKHYYSLGFVDGINGNKKRRNNAYYDYGYKDGQKNLRKVK